MMCVCPSICILSGYMIYYSRFHGRLSRHGWSKATRADSMVISRDMDEARVRICKSICISIFYQVANISKTISTHWKRMNKLQDCQHVKTAKHCQTYQTNIKQQWTRMKTPGWGSMSGGPIAFWCLSGHVWASISELSAPLSPCDGERFTGIPRPTSGKFTKWLKRITKLSLLLNKLIFPDFRNSKFPKYKQSGNEKPLRGTREAHSIYLKILPPPIIISCYPLLSYSLYSRYSLDFLIFMAAPRWIPVNGVPSCLLFVWVSLICLGDLWNCLLMAYPHVCCFYAPHKDWKI